MMNALDFQFCYQINMNWSSAPKKMEWKAVDCIGKLDLQLLSVVSFKKFTP